MGILASLRIFILPSKLDPSDIRRLEAAIVINGGGVVRSAEGADVVLTVLKGRKRISMSLSPEIMVSAKIDETDTVFGRAWMSGRMKRKLGNGRSRRKRREGGDQWS